MMRSAFFLVLVPGKDDSAPNGQQKGICGMNEAVLGTSGAPPIFWSTLTLRLEQTWSRWGATSTMPSNSPATAELPQTTDDTTNDVVKKLQIPHFFRQGILSFLLLKVTAFFRFLLATSKLVLVCEILKYVCIYWDNIEHFGDTRAQWLAQSPLSKKVVCSIPGFLFVWSLLLSFSVSPQSEKTCMEREWKV